MKAVIFDVGGVLYQNNNLEAQRLLEQEFGLKPGELAEIVFFSESAHDAMIGQATRQEMWQVAQQNLGISNEDLTRVQVALLPEDAWDAELLAFVMSLRGKCKLAVLSDAWEGSREAIVDVINEDIFDAIVFSYEVGAQKPSPIMYQTVLSELNMKPAQTMFIDDRAKNVAGAQALGIHGVQFESRDQVITAVLDWLA